MNFLQTSVACFKIVFYNFKAKILSGFEVMEFLVKTNFCNFYTFLRITQEPLNISKISLLHMKQRYLAYQNHSRLVIQKMWGWNGLFDHLDRFSHVFFLNGLGRALNSYFKIFKLNYKFYTKSWRMFVPGFKCPESILNEISDIYKITYGLRLHQRIYPVEIL